MHRVALILCLAACSVDHTGLQTVDGSNTCENDNDCFDGDPCSTDRCVGTMCVNTPCPLGSTCNSATGECEGASTCNMAECTANGRNAATCSVGRCDGDLCVSEVEAACREPGMLCCGGGCISCTTDNPCLRPTCVGGACSTEPRAAGTTCSPGGLFCNGVGACDGAGTCNVDFRCDIPGPEGCDEVADRCTGCNTPAGCPDSVVDVDCPDLLAADPTSCQERDNREITEFACVDNICVVSNERDEEVVCNRGNGTSCGSITFGPYGSCNYSGTCDESAVQTRTVTTPTCTSANACDPVMTTESQACTRTRTGMGCGDPTFGAFGACDYSDMCDQSAVRRRDRTVFTCGSDMCNSMTTTGGDSEACTRNTNGMSCAPTTNGSWSACMPKTANVCNTEGTQSRSVMMNTCVTGSCSTATTTETQDCPLLTNGLSCGTGVTMGMWSACMPGGADVCSTAGTRSRSVMTSTCMAGACTTDTTTMTGSCSIETNGTACGTPTVSGCVPSGGPGSVCSSGTITTTMRVCDAGTCTGVGGMTTAPCNPPNTTACTDPSLCIIDGTCNGSNCTTSSTICAESMCRGGAGCGGDTCQCGGTGTGCHCD